MANTLPPLINLRRIRVNRELTQAEVGARATPSLSPAYIGLLESGFRPTSAAQVESIANALGVPPHALTAERLRIDIASPSGLVRISA